MRLLRAPVVATGILAVVVGGALLDREPAPATAKVVVAQRALPSTSTTVVLPPRPTTTAPASTTTLPPHVEGDDDPEAIDGRTWTWDQLADCESGSWGANKVPNPGTARWDVTRSIYQGGLQFAAGTWDTYAEPDFPADAHLASREQQIVVAEKVIQRQGPRAWPTCAPRLGMIGTDLPLDAPVAPSVPLAEALP
jgi:hypothetical protein